MPAERGSFFRDGSEKRRERPREKTADEKCRGFEYNKLGKSFQKKNGTPFGHKTKIFRGA
jgi:hypothetical protein